MNEATKQGMGTRTLLLLALALSSAACAVEAEQAPPGAIEMSKHPEMGGAPSFDSCNGDESLQQVCTVYITQANGVTSCFSGLQFCDEGKWSDCFEAEDVIAPD